MPEVLPELVIYALLFFAVAFAFAARKLTQALFGPLIAALQSIPLIGGKLAAPFHAIEQAVTNACYSIENGADKAMGAIWHRTVELLNWTWREVKRHALVGVETALYIPLLISAYHNLRNLVRRLSHVGHGVTAAVKTLEREFHGIEHRVKTLERDISKGIGHDLRIRIKALERWEKGAEEAISTTIPNAIAGVEADLSGLKQWIGAKVGTNFQDWAVGVLLAALAAIGLSGLVSKCNPLRRQKDPCAWWNGLDSLLGLATATLLALEFEQLIKEMQAIEHDVTVAAKDVFNIG